MKRPSLLFAFAIFLFYLFTLSPTIYWRDSGEFITAAWGLGIAHPAGSPLYLSLAKFFTLLPFGPIPFRVNLFSALTAAAAVYLLCEISFLLLSRFLPPSELPRRYLLYAAYLPALLLGVSASLWEEATIAEVYGPQIFFFLLVVRFLLEEKPGYRRVALFLVGLGAGVHITILFYLPAAIFIALPGTDRGGRLKEVSLLSFCLVLGLSVYLYLPIRSSGGPYFNWGEPRTLQQFFIHVTDRKDKSYHWALNPEGNRWKVSEFGSFLLENFTLPFAILGLAGAFLVFKAHRRIGLFLLLLFLPNFLFFIRYWDTSAAYLPSFAVCSLWVSCALLRVLSFFYSCRIFQALPSGWFSRSVAVISATAVAVVLFLGLPTKNRREHRFSEEIYSEFLSELKPVSLFFSQIYYFQLGYLQQVEGARPDVILASKSDVYQPHYFTRLTQQRFPRLEIPDTGLRDSRDMPLLISMNTDRPIYWEPDARTDDKMLSNLVPRGFFYEIVTEPQNIPPVLGEHFARIRSVFDKTDRADEFMESDDYTEIFRDPLNNLGIYFLQLRMGHQALVMFQLILARYPHSAVALTNIGHAYFNLGDYAQAEKFYRRVFPQPEVEIALGGVYLSTKRYDLAEKVYRELLRRDPNLAKAYFGLGRSLEEQSRTAEAREAYERALPLLERDGEVELAKKAQEKLKMLPGKKNA